MCLNGKKLFLRHIFKNIDRMARRKGRKKQEETIVDLVEARDQAQNFFEKNQILVIGIAAVLLLAIGGYLAYQFLVLAPREKQAIEQMYKAEYRFSQDSFALALENPGGGFEGFLDIIDNYGGTKTANTAKYYAGISYLNLGRTDAAIEYLKEFKPAGSDIMPIMKYGALGDAYSENSEFDQAIASYKKAVNAKDNEFLTPYYLNKLALLLDHQGEKASALETFQTLKKDYPDSAEGKEAEKYILKLQS
jgi:tetratricopeptide (TPR) repeat protein